MADTLNGKNVMLAVVGVTFLVGGIIIYNTIGARSDVSQRTSSSDAFADKKAESEQEVETEGSSDNEAIIIDQSAALIAYQNRIESLETQIGLIEDRNQQSRQETYSSIEGLNRQLQQAQRENTLANERLLDAIRSQQDIEARNERTADGSDLQNELNFEEGGLVFESSQPSSNSAQGGTGGTQSGSEQAGTGQIPGNTGSFRMINLSRSTNTAVEPDLLPPSNKELEEMVESQPTTRTITIAASSFADATLLYGVGCPIVGNIAQGLQASSSGFGVPVVIPVQGIFKGPNSDTQDIGNANILATCRGQRTSDGDYGLAIMDIRALSYVDDNGDEHYVDVTGQVIDSRPGQKRLGIRGPIDKAATSRFWNRALLAAVSTASYGLSAQNVVLSASDGEGGYTQEFQGNPIQDMFSQGFGGYFQDLQAGYQELINASVDKVQIPSGINIRVVFDRPVDIEVDIAENNFYGNEEKTYF